MRLSRAVVVVALLVPTTLGAQPPSRGSPYGALVRPAQPEIFDPEYLVAFRLFATGSRHALTGPLAAPALSSGIDRTGSLPEPVAPHR